MKESSFPYSPMWTPESAIPEGLRAEIEALDANSSPNLYLYAFLKIIYRLKATERTGWINYQVEAPESIADHMYRMGIICMLTNRDDINIGRCVQIALVHDMAEALVGDITPFDPVSKEEKHRREYESMVYMTNLIKPFNERAAKSFLELWEEYENISSPEARFVKDVDKFELMVQTLDFESRDGCKIDLGQFMGVRKAVKTPEVAGWADGLFDERDKLWEKNGKKYADSGK